MGYSALTPPSVGQSTQASLWSSSHSDIWRTPIPTIYRVKVGTMGTKGDLTSTLLGCTAGQRGGSCYTADSVTYSNNLILVPPTVLILRTDLLQVILPV